MIPLAAALCCLLPAGSPWDDPLPRSLAQEHLPPGEFAGGEAQEDFEPPHDSLSGFFDDHFSSTAWRDNVWRDYLTEPPVLLPLALGVAAAAVSHWDRSLQRHLQGKWGQRAAIGNATNTTLIVGAVALGIFFPGDDRNAWDEIWMEAESFGISAATTSTLKFAVRRHRPGQGGRYRSFPSGHATSSFTAAALIERNCGWELGLPAYALAAVTALSRIEAGDHFPSDVLAGAAIGVLTAEIMDALHWGTGRDGRGIARPPVDLTLGSRSDPGFELGITFGF